MQTPMKASYAYEIIILSNQPINPPLRLGASSALTISVYPLTEVT